MAKKPLTFWKADEVKAIAETLIADFHQHIGDVTVLYVFRSEHSEENGKVVLGKARKVSGLNAYLAWRHLVEDEDREGAQVSSFYVVEIAHDTWAALTGPQRLALVDHELSHIGADGLLSHDVEEFSGVIERHGLWRPALEEFIEASQQQPLFETSAAQHAGLTPAQLGEIRSHADLDARVLMRIALDAKRQPTSEERAKLETAAFDGLGVAGDQISPAHLFYTREVERAMRSRFDEFNATKGHGSRVLDTLVDEAAKPNSKIAKTLGKGLKKGESVTISTPGRAPVTIHSADDVH
jgi:hypothetical protein